MARLSPFAAADPAAELIGAYQRGGAYNPVSRRTVESALEPFDLKFDQFAGQSDSQIRTTAETAVLTRHRSRREAAAAAAALAETQRQQAIAQAQQQQAAAAAQQQAQQQAAQQQAAQQAAAQAAARPPTPTGQMLPNTSVDGTSTAPTNLPRIGPVGAVTGAPSVAAHATKPPEPVQPPPLSVERAMQIKAELGISDIMLGGEGTAARDAIMASESTFRAWAEAQAAAVPLTVDRAIAIKAEYGITDVMLGGEGTAWRAQIMASEASFRQWAAAAAAAKQQQANVAAVTGAPSLATYSTRPAYEPVSTTSALPPRPAAYTIW